MARLQQQQTRFYEYMRPRYSNPTYASDNMGASLFPLPSAAQYLSQPRHKSLPKFSEYVPQKKEVKQQNIKPQSNRTPSRHNSISSKKSSNLSNYGSSSLGKLPKYFSQQLYASPSGNEVEVYERQAKKYNIITMQPKPYPETIKKYPKYHLQNLDQNFYKKLVLEDEYRSMYRDPKNKHHDLSHKKKATNPEKRGEQKAQVKYYRDPEASQNQNFRAKMLNNIDELGGVV